MPTGYRGEGKTFLKSTGKWVKEKKDQAFDYDAIRQDSASLMVSFFRYYPDYFADLCRSPSAKYKLELPQRMMMRIEVRYRNTYTTGCRGLTKTYVMVLTKMIVGILWPGEITRYVAPNQKQAAALATQAFHQIEKDYPLIAQCWNLRNDRSDMFRITTVYGSEFTMYAPRGDNSSATCAEEIGQEGEDGFDMEKYEKDVLPTCRLERKVNKKPDITHIDLKHSHISNACSKTNRAYTVHRDKALKQMICGKPYEGYVIDFSFVTALMSNIRNINYIEDQRKTLSPENFIREMCARYTGTGENPMISDEVLSKSKKLKVMEDRHCGDEEAIYIVSHDVSYVDSRINAKCADVVLKLTKYESVSKRDKYRKQVVYVDAYPPPKTAYKQAKKLRGIWERYCLDGAQATYLVIDAQAYGTEVVEELMKPTDDGSKPLCSIDHSFLPEIEQPNALPVVYPMKAGTRGTKDADGIMIEYAQNEFEKGYVELLTSNVLDGVEGYKNFHDIKDNSADALIAIPYKMTELLCQQIANLCTQTSGMTLKEKRKSKSIQRDIWSALKYALRMAQILEDQLKKAKYKSQSSWSDLIEKAGHEDIFQALPSHKDTRTYLLSLRKTR